MLAGRVFNLGGRCGKDVVSRPKGLARVKTHKFCANTHFKRRVGHESGKIDEENGLGARFLGELAEEAKGEGCGRVEGAMGWGEALHLVAIKGDNLESIRPVQLGAEDTIEFDGKPFVQAILGPGGQQDHATDVCGYPGASGNVGRLEIGSGVNRVDGGGHRAAAREQGQDEAGTGNEDRFHTMPPPLLLLR
jgi:hypothetical protein